MNILHHSSIFSARRRMVGLDEINLSIHGTLSLASMIRNIHEWGLEGVHHLLCFDFKPNSNGKPLAHFSKHITHGSSLVHIQRTLQILQVLQLGLS